jgi:hypothetical protein
MPDGLLLSYRFMPSGGGYTGGLGLDVAMSFRDGKIGSSLVFEAGVDPLSLFGTQALNTASKALRNYSVTVGPIFSMNNLSDVLSGASANASWPLLVGLKMPGMGLTNRGFLNKLAQGRNAGVGFTALFGHSLSGSTSYIQAGLRGATFSSTISGSIELAEVDVPEHLRPILEKSKNALSQLGMGYSQFENDPRQFLGRVQ